MLPSIYAFLMRPLPMFFGESPVKVIVLTLLLGGFVFLPHSEFDGTPYLVLAGVLGWASILRLILHFAGFRYPFFQWMLMATLCIASLYLFPNLGRASYAEMLPLRAHIYIPIGLALVTLAVPLPWLCNRFGRRDHASLPEVDIDVETSAVLASFDTQRHTEQTTHPHLEQVKLIPSLFSAIGNYAGLILIVPSLLMYVAIAVESLLYFRDLSYTFPNDFWLRGWLAAAVLVYLTCAVLQCRPFSRRRLNAIQSSFFSGGTLIVSAAVLIVTALTLMEISYVVTVVQGCSFLVVKWIGVFYLLFWNYDCLINQYLNELVMERLQGSSEPAENGARYCLFTHRRTNYRIVPHGLTGLAIVRLVDNREPGQRNWLSAASVLSRRQLLDKIVDAKQRQIADQADASTNIESSSSGPNALAAAQSEWEKAHLLSWTASASQTMLSFAVVLIVAVPFVMGKVLPTGLWGTYRQPMVSINADELGSLTTAANSEKPDVHNGKLASPPLAETLFANPATVESPSDGNSAPAPILLVSGSGGGTRAALFTTSILEEIELRGHADKIRMVCGASGGCVSLAYFVSHREELLAAAPSASGDDAPAWDRFYDKMSQDYIQDVLRDLSEIRTLNGVTLATPLSESFERAWGLSGKNQTPPSTDTGPAFIAVTTLAGVYPPYTRLPSPKKSNRAGGPDTFHAGGRLLLTNFSTEWYPSRGIRPNHVEPYSWDVFRFDVLSTPDIPWTQIGAMSANFPPVFQNVGLNVIVGDEVDRTYWLTDGGVADNRGVLPMLLALEGALQADNLPRPAPDIHVVCAEATRVDVDYSHDWGQNAAFISQYEVSNRVIALQLARVRELYEQKCGAKIFYHPIPLPACLRMRNGIQTHWMPDQSVHISALWPTDANSPASVTLKRESGIELLRLLPASAARRQASKQLQADPRLRQALQLIETEEEPSAGTDAADKLKNDAIRALSHQGATQRLWEALEE